MSNGYVKVKSVYKYILDGDKSKYSIKDNSLEKYINLNYDDVIKSIDEEEGFDYTQAVAEIMSVSKDELERLIKDTIYSNFYCDFELILQNLDPEKHRVIRKHIIGDLNLNSSEAKRFRTNVQPGRLNTFDKLADVEKVSDSYFQEILKRAYCVPNMLQVYKDVCFVKRQGTDIDDFSNHYVNIVKMLFCDTDEDVKNKTRKRAKKIIRSGATWKLKAEDIDLIIELFENVCLRPVSGYSFSEQMLIEKLFGIITLSHFFVKKSQYSEENLINMIKAIRTIHQLGYCELHSKIISNMTEDNYKKYDRIIKEYIYPICMGILTTTLNDVFSYCYHISNEKRVESISRFLETCKKNCNSMRLTGDSLVIKKAEKKKLVCQMKTLLDVPISFQNSEEEFDYIFRHSDVDWEDHFDEKYRETYKDYFDVLVYNLNFAGLSYGPLTGISLSFDYEDEEKDGNDGNEK